MNGQNGKGDAPRPFSVSQQEYADNWQRAFGEKPRPKCCICRKRRVVQEGDLCLICGTYPEQAKLKYGDYCGAPLKQEER